MIGEEIELPLSVKPLRWVLLTTDIPTFLLEIIKGNMTVREYLASMKGEKEFAVLSHNGPLPFLTELVFLPQLWWKRGFSE